MLNVFRAFKGQKSREPQIGEPANLVVKPSHHTNIIMYHVWALVIVTFLIIFLYLINWMVGLASFTLTLTFLWFSLFNRLPVFRLNEQYAAFVMLFGKPISMLWIGNGKVELLNEDEVSGAGTLLRLEEIYISSGVKETDKLVKLMIEDAEKGSDLAGPFLNGKKAVYYKIRETSRQPKATAFVKVPVKKDKGEKSDLSDYTSDETQWEPQPYKPSEIYYEFEGSEYSLEKIMKGTGLPANFPDDFFDTVTGGFYVKNGTEHIPADIDEVLDEEVEKKPQKATIIGRDRSNNKVSGGLFFTGLWPFFNVHEYRFRWSSQETDGSPKPSNLDLKEIYHGDDQFLFIIDHVEVKDMLQVTLYVLVTARVVCPYHALFSAQKWLEMVSGLIRQNFRTIVGGMSIDEVRLSKASITQTLSTTVMAKVCDPKAAKIQRRYGVLIHQVELADIKPEDIKEDNPLAAPFIARQKAIARRTAADAERDYTAKVGEGEGRRLAHEGRGRADAVRMETEEVQKNPGIALPLAYVRGLKEVGAGSGNTVLVGADIMRVLSELGAATLKKIGEGNK